MRGDILGSARRTEGNGNGDQIGLILCLALLHVVLAHGPHSLSVQNRYIENWPPGLGASEVTLLYLGVRKPAFEFVKLSMLLLGGSLIYEEGFFLADPRRIPRIKDLWKPENAKVSKQGEGNSEVQVQFRSQRRPYSLGLFISLSLSPISTLSNR